MSYLSYYKKMLAKGYRVGPSMDHDNHYTTFGRTSYSRLAVIAPSLNNSSFFTAMRNRNFYATEDCDTRISFTVNNSIMGSEINGTTAPAINVNVTDPTSPNAATSIKLMKGTPGSGIDATEVASASGNNLNFTDNSLQAMNTGYYYADITVAGSRSITAPIWYTRTANVLAVQLLSFNAVKKNNQVVDITWTAAKEETTQVYEVQRSANGAEYITLSSQPVINGHYVAEDTRAIDGLNYYRLKIVDKDGKITYSKVVTINFNTAEGNSFTVYPNPVHNNIQLSVHASSAGNASIIITDIYGRTVLAKDVQVQQGNKILSLDASRVRSGTYFITLHLKNEKLSTTIVKL
jgi:trimeric autotransporter adhesin